MSDNGLVAWLSDVLDDVETDTRADTCDTWHTRYCGNQPGSAAFGDCECDVPAAVLADVAAKRAIVGLYQNAASAHRAGSISRYNEIQDGAAVDVLDATLQLLASAYRDRPGYHEEWAPERMETQ